MECHAQCARHVIVASSRGTQPAWRVWRELIARAARQNAQPFKRTRHVGPFQAVIAMLPLNEHLDQALCLQSIQVYARG